MQPADGGVVDDQMLPDREGQGANQQGPVDGIDGTLAAIEDDRLWHAFESENIAQGFKGAFC